MLSIGEKKFRGSQIFEWINQRAVYDFSQMTNLPKSLRQALNQHAYFSDFSLKEKLVSKDGTVKYLFSLGGSEGEDLIESVLMEYDYGNSVCLSSQAGCRMGCSFCASAIGGLTRNLSAGEMTAQVGEIQKDQGKRISRLVIMGCGEPLDNFDNTVAFINLVNHKDGLNIGQRHITLSTCGLVDRIYDLARLKLQINLALSLHAPDDKTRRSLMPIGKTFSIDETLEACSYYAKTTGRRVTMEYALIKDVNDSKQQAHDLSRKLAGKLFHVNLIPLNQVRENYERSADETAELFKSILVNRGIETTVRRRLGDDIAAACGQLRHDYRKL